MFGLFFVPVVLTLLGCMFIGPLCGILIGILTAMLHPYWIGWRAERAEIREYKRLHPKAKLTSSQRWELAWKILVVVIFWPSIFLFAYGPGRHSD